MRYDLAKLARSAGRKNGRAILPPIEDRLGTVKSYNAALLRIVNGLAAETRATIVPFYNNDKITRDADTSTFSRLRQLAGELLLVATATVNRVLSLESQRHTEKFRDIVHRTIGIDVTAVVRQEDLADYLRQAAARNVSLITNLTDDTLKRIEQTVLKNSIAGNSKRTLEKELTEQFGIVGRRARLIARDQTAKMVSDLNRIRQEQAGITSYKWATSKDERVRPLHRGLEGKEYAWGKPTGAENGLPPGQPVQCRCVARGIVDFTGDTPSKPVETNTPEQLDQAAKKYVVEQGLKTGTEHLDGYDATLLLPVEKSTSGQRSFVGFSDALVKAISNPVNRIVLHHNHPMSSSFSRTDVVTLFKFPGLKTVWAHGHNGSSFMVERAVKMTADQIEKMMNRVEGFTYSRLNAFNLSREIDASDLGKVHMHIVMLIMQRAGMVKYQSELAAESLAAWERNRTRYEKIVTDWKPE